MCYRQLLVRHYKVYYPVRHHLIQHMVSSIQRLGLTPNVSTQDNSRDVRDGSRLHLANP